MNKIGYCICAVFQNTSAGLNRTKILLYTATNQLPWRTNKNGTEAQRFAACKCGGSVWSPLLVATDGPSNLVLALFVL